MTLVRTKAILLINSSKLYKYETVFGVKVRSNDDHIIQTMNQEMGNKFLQIEPFNKLVGEFLVNSLIILTINHRKQTVAK